MILVFSGACRGLIVAFAAFHLISFDFTLTRFVSVMLLQGCNKSLDLERHESFLLSFYQSVHGKEEQKTGSSFRRIESILCSHLKMNAIYWASTSLYLVRTLTETGDGCAAVSLYPRDEILDFVLACYYPELGAFGPNIGDDPHITSTLSAIQLLLLYDGLGRIDTERVGQYVQSLVCEHGAVMGDMYGEEDTRFSYCAFAIMSLLRLELAEPARSKAIAYMAFDCANFDGGYGAVPGGESHAGQIFCCVGALAMARHLHLVERERLSFWLAERQIPGVGGLNGRPQKLQDVCYSWWVLSALSILQQGFDWIDHGALIQFILDCQVRAWTRTCHEVKQRERGRE